MHLNPPIPRTRAALWLAAILALAACRQPPAGRAALPAATPLPAANAATGAAPAEVFVGPHGRRTRLHLPANADSAAPVPLLLLLHGYGADGPDIFGYLQADRLIRERGLAVLAPDGTPDHQRKRFWDAAPSCCDFDALNPDDTTYLLGLIDEAAATGRVDATRVYVAGFSNGGYMAYRLACDHADRFRGVVSIGGSHDETEGVCTPARPVRLLQVHGQNDPIIPWAGGSFGPDRRTVRPVAEVVQRWADRNGCAESPEPAAALDLDQQQPGAETSVRLFDRRCGDARVALWTVGGARHAPRFSPAGLDQVFDFLLGE